MRRLILKIHLLIALIAGSFMVLLGATGSIIAFQPELDRVLHRDLTYVQPGGKVRPLVEIGNAVSRNYDDEPIVAFLPSVSPDFPTQVILSRGIVSVNQYTGEILGIRARGQTFLGLVRALHVRLAAGDVGRNILRWSAVAMVFSLASGLYLWWPVKRVRIRGPRWSTGFWFDVHNAVGIFSLLPLLVLAATGVVIGFEDQVAPVIDKLTGTRPVHVNEVTKLEPRPESQPITPDQAVAIAVAQLPGAVPYRVQMPRYGGVYVVALAVAQDRLAGERNSVSVDPWSGKIVSASFSTSLTARERVMVTNEAMHTGEIFGMPSRIIVALAGILLPIQALSGIVMWLRQRRNANSRLSGGGAGR